MFHLRVEIYNLKVARTSAALAHESLASREERRDLHARIRVTHLACYLLERVELHVRRVDIVLVDLVGNNEQTLRKGPFYDRLDVGLGEHLACRIARVDHTYRTWFASTQ